MKAVSVPPIGLRRSPHFLRFCLLADRRWPTLRPMHHRQTTSTAPVRHRAFAVLLVAVPLSACSAGTGATARAVPTTAAAPITSAPVTSTAPLVAATSVDPAPPLAGSAAHVPVTASLQLPATDAVAGLHRIQQAVDTCLQRPDHCDVAAIAVSGSPAYRYLVSLRRYYLAHALVLHRVPELSYVVVEDVRMVSPDRAEITLCEVDGSWQMDSRRTRTTADDIVWDDSLISRRARHTLVRVGDSWKRTDIVELQLWLGEQRCPASASV